MALFYLSQIFKLWMLVDAYRRRPDPIWWFIIIFAPFGEWIYFFVVKRHDLDVPRMRHSLRLERPPSIKQLRAKLDYSASLANKTELAQGLTAAGEYEEAITLFREILARSEYDARARHGLGRALLEHGDAAEAVVVLAALTADEGRYSNDDAWVDLVEARWNEGDVQRALEEHQKLVSATGRLDVQLDLAERLRGLGRIEEARDLVAKALQGHEQQPAFVKRRDRAWARRARSMRKSLREA